MLVLGIETSCDDTGMAIYDDDKKIILSNKVYNQNTVHSPYGGVVPELASRNHVIKIIPLIKNVLKDAGLKSIKEIHGIAYTNRPGLIGSLLVGATFAKTLGLIYNIPTISVHHLEGHLMSPFLERNHPKYPHIALLISGGHTQLIKVDNFNSYTIIGKSVDDAAGEAFDKIGQMLDLGYPGGPYIEKLAAMGGENSFFNFPLAMCNKPNLNFSFSGLKTAVLYSWRKHKDKTSIHNNIKNDIAFAFQETLIKILKIKCMRALNIYGIKHLVISGGVSANKQLRDNFDKFGIKHGIQIFYPHLDYCTDNGAMIAITGAKYLKKNIYDKNMMINIQSS